MRKGFTLIELMIVIAIIAIIAAIAIPNLLESRVTANEGAAAASLKSGIFPGEVQFQAGGYEDLDQNNVGEYGTIETLAGLQGTLKITPSNLKLVQGALASGPIAQPSRTGNGYMFTSFLSTDSLIATGANVVTTLEGANMAGLPSLAASTTDNERLGERYFIVGCCPEMWGDTGRRVFFISQEGQVRSPSTMALQAAWYNATDPSANAGVRSASVANLQKGMVAALTGTAAAPGAGTDVTGNTYVSPTGPTGKFNTDYPVLAK